MDRLLLRVAEAADLMGCARSTAYERIATGDWPSVTLGKSKRVPLDALRAWVDSHTAQAGR